LRKFAISCIKFQQGGPRRILDELLPILSGWLVEHNYTADVYVGSIINELPIYERIQYVEVTGIYQKSIVYRLYWEKIITNQIARNNSYHHWLSLHDISVCTEPYTRSSVYLHNPMFYSKPKINWLWFDPPQIIFRLVYLFLYKLNIKSNSFIVVQQLFFKKRLLERIPEIQEKIIISRPNSIYNQDTKSSELKFASFFYPAFPRIFKGHNLLLKIANKNPEVMFFITIDGTENRLSKYLFKKYGNLKNVKWLGRLNAEEVYKYYLSCDALFFPSELETWGLPLTEARNLGKPIVSFNDCQYLNGPLDNYDRLYLINRDDTSFSEFLTNPSEYKLVLSEGVKASNWIDVLNKMI
jgi:glycosyltransferase involved in cell wall biosynthesis